MRRIPGRTRNSWNRFIAFHATVTGSRLTIDAPQVEGVLVRPSGLVLAAAVFVLGTAGALAATDPHHERERLRPADMTLARKATIKATDLASGWQRRTVGRDDGSKCPGFDPDFSAFTITGKASSLYARLSVGAVLSTVEVYKTRAQAIGDFRTGAKPAF